MLDVGIVVVNTDNVGRAAFPTVVTDHRTGGVKGFRQMIQRFDRMPLLAHGSKFGHAPGLVERHPDNDAGVAVVALDDLSPLANCPLDGAARETISRGHFLPNHESQCIGPVEIPRVLNLLVLADAIEAHGLGQLHILAQRLVAGRREQGVRPIPLVKHEPQHVGTPVEHEAVTQDMYRAHSGV